MRAKNLRWPMALLMVAAGLPGVVTGARTIVIISERTAEISLGSLTALLGVYAMLKKDLGHTATPKNREATGMLIGGLVLFCLGFLNGALSSGSGLFVTLWMVLWFGFDFKHATAYTMILVGFFWNGTGAITLATQTAVQWSWLPMLLCGSFFGGYFGAYLADRFGNPLIKSVFACISILAGLSLIFRHV
jgi:uncharacterized membrane protein YfcA